MGVLTVTEQAALAEGLVRLLKAEPTLLDATPIGDPVALINHRTRDEIHACLRCPSTARVAYLADCGVHGQRFVDLCPPCARWLRDGLDEVERKEERRRWTACVHCGHWSDECACEETQ
jgi:hypothetical protein